jgi:hypothetical protein
MTPEIDKKYLINFVCSEDPEKGSFHGEAICVNNKVKDLAGNLMPGLSEFKHLDGDRVCFTYFFNEEIVKEID